MFGLRLRTWFYIVNFGLLASLIGAIGVDQNREWASYQKRYYKMAADAAQAKLASAKTDQERASLAAEVKDWKSRPVEIHQIILNDLGRVDRCVSCHVGMDEFVNPSLTNDFKENPFKAHPDVAGLIRNHPFRKYGCTECHAGQGLATTKEGAHGDAKFWETQVMKEPFIQGSCAKCHQNFETLKGAEIAAKGRRLFEDNGCIGCHSINGSGGVISVDLGEIADKPVERISFADFHDANMPAEHSKLSVKNWILAHLMRDPMEVVHNDPLGKFNAEPISPSGMPPFYLDLKQPDDAYAITTYLLSLSHENIPHEYFVYAAKKTSARSGSEIERGKLVFKKYGCAACHGVWGQKGRRNFNALGPGQDPAKMGSVEEMEKGREPTLVDVLGTYNRDELRAKIQTGVSSSQVRKFNPNGPTPPLYMPTWKEKIKGEELEDLLTYLLSIAKKQESW